MLDLARCASPHAAVDVRFAGDGTIILRGDVDLTVARALGKTLGSTLAHREPLTIDLSEVTFVDSRSIDVIVEAACRRRATVILTRAAPLGRRVVTVVDLDPVLTNQ